MPRSVRALAGLVLLLTTACAGRNGAGAPSTAPSGERGTSPGPEATAATAESGGGGLAEAEEALAAGESARAVALFARFLATEPAEESARQAYLGLARAHEGLRDCAAAVRAYDTYLERFTAADDVVDVFARRGACHAELEQWERSAESYAAAMERADASLPSVKVELLARQGFARFQLGDFEAAERLLKQADEIFLAAQEAGSERFTTYYFIGMARFYLGAIHHRRFREVPIRLPEKTMAADFARKFELLTQAQEAYNYTIKAKHMYWVSAAGYQLGSLFEEFYDALMHAPVPEWLDDKQRQVYYEELKDQLRPVVNKAIWVFEKNLETARRLGYESDFIDRTERKLSDLQAILLAGDKGWGSPHPHLAPEARGEIAASSDGSNGANEAPAVDRKLFVPQPTFL